MHGLERNRSVASFNFWHEENISHSHVFMQSKKGLGTELVGVNICDLNNHPSLVPRLSPEDEWGAHKTAGNEATIILVSVLAERKANVRAQ